MKNVFEIHPLAIPSIHSVKPYFYNLEFYSPNQYIKLSDNENPYGEEYSRYPDPTAHNLQLSYCQYLNQLHLRSSNILFCNGSTECIDLIIRSFCQPYKDKICITSPTFGLFRHWSNSYGIEVIDVPLYGRNYNQLCAQNIIMSSSQLLFLCNPTNPVGSILDINQITSILENYSGIVAIDECYIEFANIESSINLLNKFPNLIIIRTFSKAWGLAGIRGGAVIASEKIINTLECIKSPFSFSKPAQDSTSAALKDINNLKDQWKIIIDERKRLFQKMKIIPCVQHVYESRTNFLLIKFEDANKVFDILLKNKIIVRNFHQYLKNCLRITVGNREQNDFLIQVLQFID